MITAASTYSSEHWRPASGSTLTPDEHMLFEAGIAATCTYSRQSRTCIGSFDNVYCSDIALQPCYVGPNQYRTVFAQASCPIKRLTNRAVSEAANVRPISLATRPRRRSSIQIGSYEISWAISHRRRSSCASFD